MEYLLHYIWHNRLYDKLQFVAATSKKTKSIEVVDTGTYNTNSGPDFLNAKIKIDGILWIGNVEIHSKASEWYTHNHDKDRAYDNVILHVVENSDTESTHQNGRDILNVKMIYDKSLKDRNNIFCRYNPELACRNEIENIDKDKLSNILLKICIDRLENKKEQFISNIKNKNYSISEAFYRQLLRFFGFGINADAMEAIANKLSWNILQKHRNNIIQIRALLFGVSNLFDRLIDDDILEKEYIDLLKEEFEFLRKMYQLEVLDNSIFRFARTRPQNFPTIRLMQLAEVLNNCDMIQDKILNAKNRTDIVAIFKGTLSDTAIDLIIINLVSVFKYSYADILSNNMYQKEALDLLVSTKMENNKIIRLFPKELFNKRNAIQSQALIHIYQNFCEKSKCLICPIGEELLNRTMRENI